MTTTALPSPIEGLQAILEPGQVTELRAFVENRRGFVETWSGYYTDLNALLEDAAKLDEMGASGVYYVPNAITPDALARREPNTCRVMRKADATTSDRDITGRRWLLQDLDPKRTKGVSATDSEKELAGEVMGRLCDLLESVGLPEPVTADSGNGFHVMLPIDLPADDGGLCKALTDALADTFTTDAVEVDRAVHNASRIWKLPGTTARKGYATEERPHRTASFLVVPEITRRASEDDLRRALASLRADVPDEAPRPAEAKPGRLVARESEPYAADGPPASEEVPHVLSFFETRPDYETWTKIIAGVLDRCVGDVHEAERYLATAFPEEVPGEYRKKLASPRDARWPLVVHMAKERGYDPSTYYRDWLRENGAKPTNGKAHTAEPTSDAPDPEPETVGTLVSDARREPVTWIWHPWIAVGKITVIDGDPGLGKSTLTYDLAARVSRGDLMPDEDAPPPERKPGGVVIANSEDGLGDTIRPRLEAAGAVLERVVHVSMVPDEEEGRERVLTIPDDLHHIEAAARRVDAQMVVIDPLMAHLGRDTNSFRDQDVRRALAPLADFADRARLAIVVVRHLNKMGGGNALYRGGGSIGIIGAARVGLMVGRDPEDDERVILAPTKNNLARMPRSLAFSLVGSPDDPDVSMVEWEGPVDLRAHDLLSSPSSKSKKEDAADWLMGKLAGGPLPSNDLIEEGKSLGFSRPTLFRARDEIGVKAKPVGSPAHGGYWTWTLPTTEDNDAPF